MFYYAFWECHTLWALFNHTCILLVKFQLNWSILKILTFEPLYDPLMTFYYIALFYYA